MRADHLAPSTETRGENRFGSTRRDPLPDRIGVLVDDVLRTAAATARVGRSRDAEVPSRDPMGELCAAARANDVQAERLILAIKESWRRLPDSHLPSRLDAEVTLAGVITRCIREYYAPHRP